MILVRLATDNDIKFIEECIEKHWKINDKYGSMSDWYSDFGHGKIEGYSDLDYIRLYLNPNEPQDIFIVNNGQKDIGFFTQDVDTTNQTLGGTTWVHPRACKMSILKMTKAIVIRANLIKDDYKYCEFNVWHPLLVSTIKSIIPKMQVFYIRDDYRICYIDIADGPDVEEIKARFNVTDIDKNYCFVFDDR